MSPRHTTIRDGVEAPPDETIQASATSLPGFAEGLRLMQRLEQEINTALEPSQLIEAIYQETRQLVPADAFTLSLCTEDPEIVDLYAVDQGNPLHRREPIGPLTRWTCEHREPFMTSDDRRTPPPVAPAVVENGVPGEPCAYIFVPLIARDRPIGVISIQSHTRGVFTNEHMAILSAVAGHSAVVLDNVQLLTRAQQRTDELARLERIGYELASKSDVSDVLRAIITDARDLLKADLAAIYAYDERKGRFRKEAFTIIAGAAEPTQRAKPPRAVGLTIRIAHQRVAIITRVLLNDEVCFEEIPAGRTINLDTRQALEFDDADTLDFLRQHGIRTSIGVPLRAGSDTLGVLYVSYLQAHEFSRDELQTITRLVQHAATAIQRVNVYAEIRALHEAGHALTSETEMRAVFRQLCDLGHGVLGADLISVVPYHATSDAFELPPLVSGELYVPDMMCVTQPGADGVVLPVLKGPETKFVRDAQTDELFVGPDPSRSSRFVRREKVVSVAAAQLRARGEIVGVLFLNYRTRQRFGSHQKLLIETFADYAATAIQRARLLSRRLEELKALAEIDKAITSSSWQMVLDKIVYSACQIIGVDHGAVLLKDEGGEYLYEAARHGTAEGPDLPRKYKIGKHGVTGLVAERKSPIRIGDIHEPRWRGIYIEVVPGMQSELDAPILDEQKNLIGVINVESPAKDAFTEDDERLLMALADQALIAIRNQRQFEAVERRAIQLKTAAEVARDVAGFLTLDKLLDRVVNRIHSSFGFYHVGVFLVDEQREYAALTATNSEGGQRMLARGHKLKVGEVGIVGHVAGDGRPRIARDVDQDAIYLDNPEMPDTRSEMSLPLKAGDRTIGVLDVQSTQETAFTDEDVIMLGTLADQVTIAIENARLYEAEKRSRQVLHILNQVDCAIVSQAISSDAGKLIDLKYVLDLILRLGLDAVEAPAGNIMLYDPTRDDLYMAAERGVLSEHKGRRQKLGEGVVGKAAKERKTLRASDVTMPPWNELYKPFIANIHSELAVPLLSQGRLVGVLNAESPQVGAFSSGDQELYEMLAGQAVVALQNTERYEAFEKLRDINQLLASEYDPDRAIKSILFQACCFIQAEWGNLRLYDAEGCPTLDYVIVRSVLEPELGSDADIRVIDWRRIKPEVWVENGIVAWVAHERGLYRSQGDVQADPRYRGFPGLNIRSEMAVPLMVGQELVGVLNLESERESAFDEQDAERLKDFGAQAAIAVRAARNQEEARQAHERFRALNQTGTEIINAPSDVDHILDIALTEGFNRTGAFHAVAWLPDTDPKQLVAQLVSGEYQDARHEPIPYGEFVNGQAWEKRHCILVEDISDLPEGTTHRPGDIPTRSILVVPMLAGEEYFGNLDFRHKEAHGFKPEEIEFIKGLAAQAASAIRRVRREREFEKIRQSEREALAMAALGLVAGELGHRIGNKLGLFKTYIPAIKEEIGQGYQAVNKRLDTMSDNTQYVLTMTQQLMQEMRDYTEGVAKPKKVYQAEVILSEACHSRVPPAAIKVIVDPSATGLRVRVDDRIFDAFTNIYINAIEALEQKGGGTIKMSAREANGWIDFEIADDGPGIEANKLDKIFNLFYSTKKKDGFGFGLWSARQRVLANGGQISVKSQVGESTTFTIRLQSEASGR